MNSETQNNYSAMVNNVHYILPFLVCAFKCDIVFFWSWQECVSSTFARTTLTNGIIVSFQYIYFPLAFLFTGIHECNKHHHTTECQCFSSDMQDFANLWPLFIVLQATATRMPTSMSGSVLWEECGCSSAVTSAPLEIPSVFLDWPHLFRSV